MRLRRETDVAPQLLHEGGPSLSITLVWCPWRKVLVCERVVPPINEFIHNCRPRQHHEAVPGSCRDFSGTRRALVADKHAVGQVTVIVKSHYRDRPSQDHEYLKLARVVMDMGRNICVAHACIQHALQAFGRAMVVADGPPPLGGTGATKQRIDLLVANPRQNADPLGYPVPSYAQATRRSRRRLRQRGVQARERRGRRRCGIRRSPSTFCGLR